MDTQSVEPTKPKADDVAAELTKLCGKLIARAFRTGDELEIPKLRQLAAHTFPEEWATNRSDAVEAMLKRAISRLTGNLGDVTAQEAALLLFNLDGSPLFPAVRKLSLANIEGEKDETQKSYDFLYAIFLGRANLLRNSTTGAKVRTLRLRIAEILVDPGFPTFSSVEKQSVLPLLQLSAISPTSTAELTSAASEKSFVDLVFRGHPLVMVLGSRTPHSLGIDKSAEQGAEFYEKIRNLSRIGAIKTVVSGSRDLTLLLGDYLPVQFTEQAPRVTSCYWNPGSQHQTLGAELSAYLSFITERLHIAPVVAAIGLSDQESASLMSGISAVVADVVPYGGIIGLQTDGEPTSCFDLVELIHKSVERNVSIYSCSRVDFAEPATLIDLIRGLPTVPSIAKQGHWPDQVVQSASRLDRFGVPDTIAGPSGSGKTTFAYLRASKIAHDNSFYLDARGMESLSEESLRRLIEWLEHYHPRSVLILDNTQAIGEVANTFRRSLSESRLIDVHVIFVITKGHSIAEYSPVTDMDLNGRKVWDWPEQRIALTNWVKERSEQQLLPDDLATASRYATNFWHFFYILRGSAEHLESELTFATGRDLADVAWFAIAAQSVFRASRGTFRDLYAFMDEFSLWPTTTRADSRGRWLLEAIKYLVADQKIIAFGDRLDCRHPLEARHLVRICCKHDQQLAGRSYVDIASRLFVEEIRPIVTGAEITNVREGLSRRDVKRFVGTFADQLCLAIDRQLELEQVVPWSQALQEHIDRVWRGVVVLFETWPVHQLYWLVTDSSLTYAMFRFDPFRTLRRIPAIDSIRTESDIVDLIYVIHGITGYAAFQSAQAGWKIETQNYLATAAPKSPEISDAGAGHFGRDSRVSLSAPKKEEIWVQVLLEWEESIESRLLDADIPNRGFRKSAAWIERTWARFLGLSNLIDDQILPGNLAELSTYANAALIVNVWMLSRELGKAMFDASSEEVKDEVFAGLVRVASEGGGRLQLKSGDYTAVFMALHLRGGIQAM